MKKLIQVGFGVLLLSLTSVALAGAPKAGGGELPVPFLNSNQRVELADGEIYTLAGKIVEKEGFFYFKPDFSKHPWLGGSRRMSWPYYPLELNVEVPKSLLNRLIRFHGKAIGRIFFTDDQRAGYAIFLAPDEDQGIEPYLASGGGKRRD